MFAYTQCVQNYNQNSGVAFALTDRFGGCSTYPYESLNLAFYVGDMYENVKRNISRVLTSFGALYPQISHTQNLAYMTQIHSTHCAVVTKQLKEIYNVGQADILLSKQKNTPLMVLVADCNPILFFDKRHNAVALIHAGRAGVFAKICSVALARMYQEFGTQSYDIYAFVGAGIRKCCYEIQNDVLLTLEGVCKDSYVHMRNNKYFLDLESMLQDEFEALGIWDYYFLPQCTGCHNEFFSYRRDGITGRFGLIAQLI